MDVSSVTGLVSGLQSATTLAKSVLGMKIDSEVRDAIIALQNNLIATQSAALENLAERDELYRRLREFEKRAEEASKWEAIKMHFKPSEYGTGPVVYTSESADFPGLYCPKCFENGRPSRMQETRASNGFHKAQCLQCETVLKLSSGANPRVLSSRTAWNH